MSKKNGTSTEVISLGYNVILIGATEDASGFAGEGPTIVVSQPGRTPLYASAAEFERASDFFADLAEQARQQEPSIANGCSCTPGRSCCNTTTYTRGS